MDALALLRALRRAFPRLVVSLMLDEETHTKLSIHLLDRATRKRDRYTLDEEDMGRTVEDIVAEIVRRRESEEEAKAG